MGNTFRIRNGINPSPKVCIRFLTYGFTCMNSLFMKEVGSSRRRNVWIPLMNEME